jgi:hypothetical protein
LELNYKKLTHQQENETSITNFIQKRIINGEPAGRQAGSNLLPLKN